MTYLVRPSDATRAVVNDLLVRAKRFHASVNATAEIDVTDLRARIRAERRAGRAVSLTSFLVKATATLLYEQRHLNRHLFTGLFGSRRIVELKRISCTLVVARRAETTRDDVLLPALLHDVDTMPIDAIEARVRALKGTPLAELAEWRGMHRVRTLPAIARALVSFKARSDPDFYLKYFGSYGLSSLVRVGGHGVGGSVMANTGVAFIPGSIRRLPRFSDGGRGSAVVAREILSFGFVFDHFIFDGVQMLRAIERLAELLETPSEILGAPRTP